MNGSYELVIKPRCGWQPVDWREAFLYRELLGFLVWRDIKIRYRQTLLGGLWAVLQPLMAMLIFTFVFNRLAGVRSDGPPYPLFAFAGLAPWVFFTNALTASSNSLVSNQQLVSKIYFPRIFIPIGAVIALLVDLGFSLLLLFALMLKYRWALTFHALEVPLYILAAILSASGLGLIFSALNVRFRDVKYAVPFIIQMGLFVTPVIYPVSYLPARLRPLLALNPMTGVVMGFRNALLGTPMDANVLRLSLVVSLLLFGLGLLIFRRMERKFADII
jgi:lipopolysaccharide transport system permease protein